MKYWKNLQMGTTKASAEMPTGAWWVEISVREYNVRMARIHKVMGNLEKAVAYKKAVLKVD